MSEETPGYRITANSDGRAAAELLPRPPCPLCNGLGVREMDVAVPEPARPPDRFPLPERLQRKVAATAPRAPAPAPARPAASVRSAGKCRCRMLPDRVALFNAAGIPGRHATHTLDTFDATLDGARPGWTIARNWLDRLDPERLRDARGLVLQGAPGRGKTHLLCGLVRELIFTHGIACRFIEFTHLLASLREGFESGNPTTLTPFVEVPVLALDELGKGRKTDWELSIIDEIITRRYDRGGLLLATSNFSARARTPSAEEQRTLATGAIETLPERLGERVFSRLRETVHFAPVLGEDHRASKIIRAAFSGTVPIEE